MKDATTLIDAALRASASPKLRRGCDLRPFRNHLAQARKFTLDKNASAFLSDLSHASFEGADYCSEMDRLRSLARIPHALMWVEYDAKSERARTRTAYPKTTAIGYDTDLKSLALGPEGGLTSEDQVVPRIGWLVRQHPAIETVFRLTEFNDLGNGVVLAMPFDWAWSSDTVVPPWPKLETLHPDSDFAGLATGCVGYHSPYVTIINNARTDVFTISEKRRGNANALVLENVGELRRAIALLACINDIPLGYRHVTQAKGYVAGGQYRKFVDHTVISIVLPKGKDARTVARKVVAIVRRRAHQVRGHWRLYERGHDECQHTFTSDSDGVHLRCSCGASKTWITEHQRGDASLGFVTHDYQVETRA